ncbi:MAG: endonuclease domain-containing protein [Bacteroidales bacterium]|nr:endonuclease domain-containing protein [Bacteroidales bacterium]
MNTADITSDYLQQNGIETKKLVFSSKHLPYNPMLKSFSRKLRRDGELAEVLLWRHLKAKQTGYVFNRQKPILNFIADFYCKELGLVVEIDGLSHFSEEASLKDEERDRQMRVIGLRVIRVLDSDVRKNPEHVVKCIMEIALNSHF